MKNPYFLSFERSRYMPGRYVSALDLSRDQDYQNNKRRLMNRLLHGYGVLCGLGVSMTDEYTVAVESGCALDYYGREIVVPLSHTRKLRQLDGYEPNGGAYAYLCIEYAKELADPIHVLTTHTPGEGMEPQFSCSRDTFRLFLNYEEPPENGLFTRKLYQDTLTLYEGNGVRITQSLPRFVKPLDELVLTVRVEKRGQPLPVAFTYDLALLHCEHDGKSFCRVHFDENAEASKEQYELRYTLIAGTPRGADARVQIGEHTLKIGNRALSLLKSGAQSFKICDSDSKQAVFDRYMRQNLETLLEDSAGVPLYLAKLHLLRLGDASILDSVTPLPFEQRLINTQLSTAFLMMGETRAKQPPAARESPKRPGGRTDCGTGSAVITMPGGGECGKVYTSPEIAHGLGPGRVFVQTGIMPGGSDKVAVQGNLEHSIFPASPFRCAVAVRCEYQKGTFTIGVKPLENTTHESVEVSWMALCSTEESAAGAAEKGIYILPDVINLRTRESRRLEAHVTGLPDSGCEFFVREQNGGTVDADGTYTAPGMPGVYEVAVRSTYDASVTNSVFIVVRERTL